MDGWLKGYLIGFGVAFLIYKGFPFLVKHLTKRDGE